MYKIPAKNSILAKKIVFMPSCHSTNDICAALVEKDGPSDGLVVITDFQEKGKGQGRNTWSSEKGENITLSYYLNTDFLLAKEQYFLNMAVSLAVLGTVREFLDDQVEIKWPNDIYYGKKISGILIQNSLRGPSMEYSIVGIGLNVNQVDFPIENATSLRKISGKWYTLQSVFETLSAQLEFHYTMLRSKSFDQIKNLYMNNLRWLNETHIYENEGVEFSGKIVDILPHGNIVIRTEEGDKSFDFQRVSFIK